MKALLGRDKYHANQFEVEAEAMEEAMRDVLRRHPDLFSHVPRPEDANYEQIAQEIRDAYLKAKEAKMKKHRL